MQERQRLLEKLVRLDLPMEKTLESLKPFGLDSKEELVTLTIEDIISVLNRFLWSELTLQNVNDWAEAIELREDIEFGREGEDDIGVQEIVFKLGTPELDGPLTARRAEALIKVLNATKRPSAEDVRRAYAEP